MKVIEQRLPQEFDKSFIVFKETGKFFPCPWHYHPEYELVLVNKSTGRRMVGDHIGYFDEGDLVFMGSRLPHVWVNDAKYIQSDDENPADAIVIQFVEDFLGERFLNIPELEGFRKFLHVSERGIVIEGKARNKIIPIMKSMIGMNGIQRLSALMSIFEILSNINDYNLLASPKFVQNFQYESPGRFKKITEYILQNFNKDITLPEAASIANMGLTAFCNFFKNQFRMTFVEYLNTVRIGHACKLIAEDKHNIVEVAYECGFNNLANFNRQFKKLKNITPSDYRKLLNMELEKAS
ncbi:AraC family transcriptional regulator [Mucilaginibacter sp. CSA2-8R]|uniref:AraC family transcriptional regulator n=1 Tax=Mucilaginibacter sp. CSA2-8R TaxID=3141542 RepID=UPI00315DBB5F